MNRRDFLLTSLGGLAISQATGAASNRANTTSVRGLAGEFGSVGVAPFASFNRVFSGKCSEFFGVKMEERTENFGNGKAGVRAKRAARDPKTLYLAGGVSGEEEPHSFFLTFEITNNRILCSASSTGLLQHPCIFSRMASSQRRGERFQAEELLGGSPWGFGLRVADAQPLRLPMTHGSTLKLLETVFPIFVYQHGTASVELLAFAPQIGGPDHPNPRALLVIAQVRNQGQGLWQGSLLAPNLRDVAEVNASNGVATPVESPHPRFTEHPVPLQPGFEAMICLDETQWSPTCPEVSLQLEAGQERYLTFGLLLGQSCDELRQTATQLRQRSALEWLNETVGGRIQRYGQLSIPENPYYSENYIRLFEAGSSALLYSADGRQFTGGPSGAADFGMALFEPDLLLPTLRSQAGFSPRPSGQPAWEGLSYSLTNSVWPLCVMGLYYRMSGDREFFKQNPGLLEFARERLKDILMTRKGEPYLFPSKNIWDGPARGDYHTGSNILVWLAFDGLATVARQAYEQAALADQWWAVAQKIKGDVFRHCVGDSPLGRRFFEGANVDGSFVQGHDGEEAFTTLAPFFGFCEADEPALINHAKLAFTPSNPLYEPAVDGIWWDSPGTSWSGTSMPGQMAMLAAITSEQELLRRLEQFRGLTDADGSVWWWPYLYPCNDRQKVRRRDWPSDCSKCGYAAAIYLCQFISNILGIQVDVAGRRIALRPFCPWPEFGWEGCRLGKATFDFSYERAAGRMSARITNRASDRFNGVIELVLPPGAALISREPDGALPTKRFGRSALRWSGFVEPGKSIAMRIAHSA